MLFVVCGMLLRVGCRLMFGCALLVVSCYVVLPFCFGCLLFVVLLFVERPLLLVVVCGLLLPWVCCLLMFVARCLFVVRKA